MKKLFGCLSALLWLCLLCVAGMIDQCTVGLLLGGVMAGVNVAALVGCMYFAGAFEEYQEADR